MPIEITETQSPLIFWRKELRPDSGGAGRTRGGLGQIIEIEQRLDEPSTFWRLSTASTLRRAAATAARMAKLAISG